MLATSLGSIATPAFAAWNPNHGHLSSAGVVGDHTHPWDEPAAADSPAFDPDDYCSLHGVPHPIEPPTASEEPAPADDEPSIVFTMDADGTVAGVSAPALPADMLAELPQPLILSSTNANQASAPGSVSAQVPVPPPRI